MSPAANGTTSDGPHRPPGRAAVAKGLAAFALLSGAGLLVLFTLTRRDADPAALPHLHVGFLLLAVAGAVLDIVLGALRYQVFLRKIRPGTSLWLPIRADLANRFVGVVTPSQSGGGPAQVFVLYRGGIPVPEALSFLAINFFFTVLVFLAAGTGAVWILGERIPAGIASRLVSYGGPALLASLGLILFALGRPDGCARILERAAGRLERRRGRWARPAARASRLLAEGADRYRAACARFVREEPRLAVAGLLLTVLLYLNKFTLAWLVMRGLGAEGAFGTTLAVQALLHPVLYVAPTPGGSGLAELAIGALMALVMPAGLLGPFALLYRVLLVHAPATAGAFVLAAELASPRRDVPGGSQGPGEGERALGSALGA
jgi:uncharacterized protein (TIRG00374 family)